MSLRIKCRNPNFCSTEQLRCFVMSSTHLRTQRSSRSPVSVAGAGGRSHFCFRSWLVSAAAEHEATVDLSKVSFQLHIVVRSSGNQDQRDGRLKTTQFTVTHGVFEAGRPYQTVDCSILQRHHKDPSPFSLFSFFCLFVKPGYSITRQNSPLDLPRWRPDRSVKQICGTPTKP